MSQICSITHLSNIIKHPTRQSPRAPNEEANVMTHSVVELHSLMKKSTICRELAISPTKFEELLDDGLLPAPIWLGDTPHSRRWRASTIRHHMASLRVAARRRRQPRLQNRKVQAWA
jgi:hypothetical protein